MELHIFLSLALFVLSALMFVESRRQTRRRVQAERNTGRLLVECAKLVKEDTTIQLGKGTYRLPSTLVLDKPGVRLTGNGSWLVPDHPNPVVHVRADRVTVDSLFVRFSTAAILARLESDTAETAGVGILLDNVSDVNIEGNYLETPPTGFKGWFKEVWAN
jgi:hypothetical protein